RISKSVPRNRVDVSRSVVIMYPTRSSRIFAASPVVAVRLRLWAGRIGTRGLRSTNSHSGDVSLTLSVDNYMSAVRRFQESVSELAAKLEQVNNARDAALKASEELRHELDATDQQMQEVTSALRQQIATTFRTKAA